MLLQGISAALLLASTALASWEGNLNYRSPSINHDGLGINLRKVHKRMLTKRDGSMPQQTGQLNFTHGVASVSTVSESDNTALTRTLG